MNEEQAFQQAMLHDPHDVGVRLIFADWLEERGDPRGQLLRLTHTLTQSADVPNRPELEARLRTLVKQGVQPVGPFWTNSIGMKFAWIPPGTFMMGSPPRQKGRRGDEILHRVTLTKGFYMSIYPVTEEEWRDVTADDRGCAGRRLPVSFINWEDCQEFNRRLSVKDNLPYRLPTEAEWEYACRAGTTTEYYFGDTLSADQANHSGTKIAWRSPVGSYPANAFGLRDMHGNVWQWCQDGQRVYSEADEVDPQGEDGGLFRMMRGGSWIDRPGNCSSAWRFNNFPASRSDEFGFRVCFSAG